MSIFGFIILNLVKKLFNTSILLHCAMYRLPKRKLKIASFIEHAYRFRIHITIINMRKHALRFSKVKCLIFPFTLSLLHCHMCRVC